MKILDCTLRDGGYYTNWDFDKELVNRYCKAMESLPIDYVEVGYRSIPLDGYLGEYFYCPDFVLKKLSELMPSKKLAIILNEKDIRAKDVLELLSPCKEYITLIRIAVAPVNFERAIELAKSVKALGFEVAFNVMYMSEWSEDDSFLDLLMDISDTVDYFYMVDSFGGVFPQDVEKIVTLIKSKSKIALGFHGHNNMEMALINTIKALDLNCTIVDSTITGMGRGAGNLKTELLITYLNSIGKINVSFNDLSVSVSIFEDLRKEYNWGTNLPYMFSGAYSLPQKEVMEMVGMNRYPIASIVNALQNKKNHIKDNHSLSKLNYSDKANNILIIGGGASVSGNYKAIESFLEMNNDMKVIHTGLKYISMFKNKPNPQLYALAGFEGEKLNEIVTDLNFEKKKFVYPPHPRKMGTLIPEKIIDISYEIENISFTNATKDSPLAIAIQLGINFNSKNIYMVGFDGYDTSINKSQFKLVQENQNVFSDLLSMTDINVYSLTPTKYENLKQSSIYSLI